MEIWKNKMKYTKEEKLSIISELIQLAKTDAKVRDKELGFIKLIASSLRITGSEVDDLVTQPANYIILKPESERILQFHRLILVMNVDEHTGIDEVAMIKNFGLKMGLPASAIDDIFGMMENYENKMIPPEELLKVFKKHYN